MKIVCTGKNDEKNVIFSQLVARKDGIDLVPTTGNPF